MTYNLAEELEKAFIAGADWLQDNTSNWDDEVPDFPIENEIIQAANYYVNKEALVDGNK